MKILYVIQNGMSKRVLRKKAIQRNNKQIQRLQSLHAGGRFRRNRLAMFGLCTLFFILMMAALGPYLSGYTYYEQDLTLRNQPPSADHWFGTDYVGRDLFTRVWHGARISLFVGFAAVFFDMILGIMYGGISGLKRGRTDLFMMRIIEVIYSIPYLLIVILIMVFIGQGIGSMILAMAITGWIPMARMVRGQVLQLREQGFIQSALVFGGSTFWVIQKHIIPNAMGPILVNVTLTVPTAIFTEASLGFLGLGVQAPMSSWGTLIKEGLSGFVSGNVHLLFIPGFIISFTMFSFYLVGEGLREAVSPRDNPMNK